MTWLWLFAIVAQTTDAGLTCYQLSRGARELNPVLGQSCGRVVAMKSVGFAAIPLMPTSMRKWGLVTLGITGSLGVGVTITLK